MKRSWPRRAILNEALEALGRPAFLVAPDDSIEIANRRGAALLDRGPKGVLDAIRESGRGLGPFTVTRLSSERPSGYRLAIRNEIPPTATDRLPQAQRDWGLTSRQTRVLELIAAGAHTNKEIATAIGCAEVTVENHVTELLRRSGAKSRTDLVGRLFTLAA
jgi:DNA-binding NarL/FixJ family response regulator